MPTRRPRLNATLRYGAAAATIAILVLLALSRWNIFVATYANTRGQALWAAVSCGCVRVTCNSVTYNSPFAPVVTQAVGFSARRFPIRPPDLDWWFQSHGEIYSPVGVVAPGA